jgi:hypothetical protein
MVLLDLKTKNLPQELFKQTLGLQIFCLSVDI